MNTLVLLRESVAYFEALADEGGSSEVEFKSSGAGIDPDIYPILISIINESYTDELDRISSARENDDGSILVVGIDGGKQVACKISDDRIRIRLLNPDAAEFAAPKKSNGALKKKTCKTGLSCGGTCISKTKICARALSIEQQKQFKELKKRLKGGDADAAKGIEDLKNEQQGKSGSKSQSSPKTEAKVEAKPSKKPKKMTTQEAIAAIEATEARNSEKKTVTNKIAKLDMSDPTNEAYARAAIEAFGFAKKNADGLVVDTDNGGTTSSFDRTSELMRLRDRKSISDDDALDAGSSLRQGLRAGKGSAVNEVNQRLAKDIIGRLSDSQKKIFASELKDRDDLIDDVELLKLLKKHQ